MIIHREFTITRFRLEPAEWAIRNGRAVIEFLRVIRAAIPREARDFDPATSTYAIKNEYFEGAVKEARERYLKGN